MNFKAINEAFDKYSPEKESPEVEAEVIEIEKPEELPDVKAEMPEVESPEACDAFITETAQAFAEGTITADEVVAKVEQHIDGLVNHEGTDADEALHCVKDIFNRAKEFTTGKFEDEALNEARGTVSDPSKYNEFVKKHYNDMIASWERAIEKEPDQWEDELRNVISLDDLIIDNKHILAQQYVDNEIKDCQDGNLDPADVMDYYLGLGNWEDGTKEFNESLNEAAEENFGEKAWMLSQIIMSMNNEEAYFDSGFLYVWPDGETRKDCEADFGTKEAYDDLEDTFKAVYTEYHDDGLYDATPEVEVAAHEWDKALGLEPIENIK